MKMGALSTDPRRSGQTYDLKTIEGRRQLRDIVEQRGFEAGRLAVEPSANAGPRNVVMDVLLGRPLRRSVRDAEALHGLRLAVFGHERNDYPAVLQGLQRLYDIGFARP